MTPGLVVSNASPIIALARVGQIGVLQSLFSGLIVPPSVVREAVSVSPLPPWIQERALAHPLAPELLKAALGAGEREAIALAKELDAEWLLLDERPARRVAEEIGLPVVGTLGVLLAAKRRGHLSAVAPLVDALARSGFRIAPRLRERVLRDAGEGP